MGQIREPFEEECYYHVFNHSNGVENLFREAKNYHFFLKKLSKYVTPIANIFAYCLMPNHFHLILQIEKESKLSSFSNFNNFSNTSDLISHRFGNLQNSYAKSINKKYNRQGSLFNQSIKRKKINSEEYLRHAIIYTHLNPVSHDFCVKPEDWEYTSYKSYIDNSSMLLAIEEGLGLFDGLDNFIYNHNTSTFEKYAEKLKLDY